MHSQEVWVKDLIELLNNLGFSESYWEVQWYEYSVMADQSDQQDPDGFLQYVFDNVDFNIPIIDGHGTFHSMRGIQCSTPTSNSGSVGATKRVLTPRKASVIGCYAEVPIKPYTQPPSKALSKLTIKDPIEHEVATTVVERLDVLWISGHTIQATPHSSWAWFMQSAMQNTGTYDVSEIRTLPFINMDPSDCSTIYTALCNARAKCDKAGQKTCFVTFDQPLYIKATEIMRSSPELACVVVSLGASICWCPWWVQSDISCQKVDFKSFGSPYMPSIQWYKWYQDMHTTVHCELISWHSRL